MKIEDIQKQLRAKDLAHLADEVERLILPTIQIDPEESSEHDIAIGASKIGGRPDLPAGAAWPMRDGKPLGFLA